MKNFIRLVLSFLLISTNVFSFTESDILKTQNIEVRPVFLLNNQLFIPADEGEPLPAEVYLANSEKSLVLLEPLRMSHF